MNDPKTLQDAITFFANHDNCVAYLVERRWPDGVVICPTCRRNDVAWVAKRRVWQCKSRHPKAQFSVKVGTMMEDSAIPLEKWLPAMWMMANCKNGVSSWELHRTLGITQKSAWFVLHRIRLAQAGDAPEVKMGGSNGALLNRTRRSWARTRRICTPAVALHSRRSAAKLLTGRRRIASRTRLRSWDSLTARADKYVPRCCPNVKRQTLQAEILRNIERRSAIYTDQAIAYDTLTQNYIHETVNHTQEYIRGQVHTQGLENF
jgi:hypothetical protein